jgi:periplasmic divalent cation tolerance protein
MAFVYITCGDKEEAVKISEALLKKRMIACSNMFPIRSMYWWKGRIEKSEEIVILAKTKKEYYERIKQETRKLHSYDIPAIIMIDAEANEEYDKWVDEAISSRKA